ncbi:hypothetical protein [Streptococcus suis]|uniref:hypothetical protein n=1 Tax=Streptococcus suis TaxID=1307 RepID=UPI003768DC86|nr:hypothetical protein [Streptococcus suis]
MKKIRMMLLLMISLFCLGSFVVAKAESVPGTNLEIISEMTLKESQSDTYYLFETLEARDLFIESNSKYKLRSNGVSLTRSVFSHSYRDSATSHGVSSIAYGGQAGASLTISAGLGYSVPKYNIGLSLENSATHNVPPYTYGQIVLKSTFTVNVYNFQVQYQGSNTWHSAGKVHKLSNIRTWSELRTWK